LYEEYLGQASLGGLYLNLKLWKRVIVYVDGYNFKLEIDDKYSAAMPEQTA
jgi:hypothetical protein